MDNSKKNSVLVVDDDNSIIMALTQILNPDYTVYAAKNGLSAIRAAQRNMPNVILLDIVMPEMDGYAVLSTLKSIESTKNIPVIFITGLIDTANEERGLAAGAVDYLFKPFSPSLVKVRVQNQLRLIEQFRAIKLEQDVAILEELVHQRTAELELETSKLNAIFNASPDFIFCKDLDSRYTMCNKSTEKYFGIKESDIVGKDDSEAFGFPTETTDEFVSEDKKIISGMKSLTFEERVISGPDRERNIVFETVKAPIMKDGKVFGIMGISRDITKRKAMEEQLQAVSQAKTSFLANMSHEIRTPMNAILGISEILVQDDSLPEKTAEGLSRILNSCNLLLGIINDILDFSKIEAGKMDIVSVEYSIAALISNSTHLNMMRIGEKPIEFIVDVEDNIPLKLIGDELRIKQILNNLLSNAFKYTDSGKVTLSVIYESNDPSEDMGCLVFNVRDTGCGMTAEQVDRLFDEYSRFNRESGYTIEGTGLGLTITKRLTDLLGGEILVESEPDTGSLFTLRLPQKKVGTDVIGSDTAQHLRRFSDIKKVTSGDNYQLKRDLMPYGSVLVVDDVEMNLYVAKILMRPYSLQFDTVTSGFEAIDKVNDGNVYDIIFMDHMMPKMNGMETTKLLRDSGYTAPIVALTANALVGQEDVFLQNGFDAFISKPIDTEQLDNVLNTYIRDKQPAGILSIMDISGLDVVKGIERCERDINSYLGILRSYVAGTRSMLDVMKKIDFEDLSDYTTAVHGIKGSSLDIFAQRVGNNANFLEVAAKEGNKNYITDNNSSFIEVASKLVDDIDNAIISIDSDKHKETKDRPDNEALKRLAAACETYNLNEVNAAMEEIDSYRYESDNDLIEWLRERVDIMDYQQIVERLS
ncbi:MAG: response regulator [Oscillospiraceae bacterium]|jgi:PAS domain S-box-containing protein|nr:response regulator [Oscillospiraceae bacterium]